MEPIFIETSFLDEVIFFKDAPKIQITAASDDFPYHVEKSSAQASWNRYYVKVVNYHAIYSRDAWCYGFAACIQNIMRSSCSRRQFVWNT